MEPYLGQVPGPCCGHNGGPAPGSTSSPWPGSASGPSAQTLNFKQNQSLFRVWAKNLVIFFFQRVWAWQVPSCTVPSAPSSYNLKEKKNKKQNHCTFQGKLSLWATDPAPVIKLSVWGICSMSNGLLEPPPSLVISCFILFSSVSEVLPLQGVRSQPRPQVARWGLPRTLPQDR